MVVIGKRAIRISQHPYDFFPEPRSCVREGTVRGCVRHEHRAKITCLTTHSGSDSSFNEFVSRESLYSLAGISQGSRLSCKHPRTPWRSLNLFARRRVLLGCSCSIPPPSSFQLAAAIDSPIEGNFCSRCLDPVRERSSRNGGIIWTVSCGTRGESPCWRRCRWTGSAPSSCSRARTRWRTPAWVFRRAGTMVSRCRGRRTAASRRWSCPWWNRVSAWLVSPSFSPVSSSLSPGPVVSTISPRRRPRPWTHALRPRALFWTYRDSYGRRSAGRVGSSEASPPHTWIQRHCPTTTGRTLTPCRRRCRRWAPCLATARSIGRRRLLTALPSGCSFAPGLGSLPAQQTDW